MGRSSFLLLFCLFFPASSYSGGLVGDALRAVPGWAPAGNALDALHKYVKDSNHAYRDVEETLSAAYRQVPGVWQDLISGIPSSYESEWISQEKSRAISSGVQRIPPQIFKSLDEYFDAEFLSQISYRVGTVNRTNYPGILPTIGNTEATTLDNVIVFRSQADAQNLEIWARELGHVLLFQSLGVNGYAVIMRRNTDAIMLEAHLIQSKFMSFHQHQTWVRRMKNNPHLTQPGKRSTACTTPDGWCHVRYATQVMAPCRCKDPEGGPPEGFILTNE